MPELLRQIGLVARDGIVPMGELAIVSAALQKQVTRDFTPLWGVAGTVDVFETFEDLPSGYWPLILVAEGDVATGSGVHQTRLKQPIGFVELGPSWSLAASHEVLEMLADPSGNRLVAGDSPVDPAVRVEYLVEVCDPCQDVAFKYEVNGLPVSDFITPQYFDPVVAPGARYSFRGSVTAPHQILPGGYVTWRDPAQDRWFQLRLDAAGQRALEDLGTLPVLGADSIRSAIDAASPRLTRLSKHRLKGRSGKGRLRTAGQVRASMGQVEAWREVLERLRKKAK